MHALVLTKRPILSRLTVLPGQNLTVKVYILVFSSYSNCPPDSLNHFDMVLPWASTGVEFHISISSSNFAPGILMITSWQYLGSTLPFLSGLGRSLQLKFR